MRTNRYYLIRPKPALSQLIPEMDELSGDLLREPQLWQSPEGGRTAWTPGDYCLRAKLAFLLYLKTEYTGAPGIDFALSGIKIGETLFDLYWEIEPLELQGDVNEVSPNLLERSQVAPSGNELVDAWLQNRVR